MSFMVARMQKMKADNLVGVGNHNQRRTENHSNQDIDPSKSHLNYDLVNRTTTYKTDIQQFINEKKNSTRATRKDAVLVNEWILTSDSEYFHDLTPSETQKFFREALRYFSERFGEENIRYAHVHMDETTPHMHLGVVPFDQDNKLSAKRVFNRQALRGIQDDLPRFMNEQGFDLERGKKGSQRKNLTVPEYKKLQLELNEMKEQRNEWRNVQKQVEERTKEGPLKTQHKVKKPLFGRRPRLAKKMKVNVEDYQLLEEAYKTFPHVEQEKQRAQQESEAYKQENESLKEENKALKQTNEELSEKLHGFVQVVEVVMNYFREKTKDMNLGKLFKAMDFELPKVLRTDKKEQEKTKSREDELNGPSL